MARERFPETALDLAMAYVLDRLRAGKREEEGHFAVLSYHIRPRLPLIRSRTLILCGDQDHYSSHVEAVKSLVPQNQVKIIEGGTGRVLRLRPREWAEAVRSFLAECLAT